MPLTTDLTAISTTGTIEGTMIPPTVTNIASNYFSIDGCLSYIQYIDNVLTMYKIRNKGYVMATQSFIVQLEAIDITSGIAYPIAM